MESVMVNGEWVKGGGKLVKVKWEDIISEYREAVKSVDSRGLAGRRRKRLIRNPCKRLDACLSD